MRQWIAIETNEIRMEKSYWEYLSTEMFGQWPWFVHGCSTHAHKLFLWKASAILFFSDVVFSLSSSSVQRLLAQRGLL